jgi:hypothetical protein
VEHFSPINYATRVWVSGNYAYIADGSAKLTIVDFSDPSNPQYVSTFNTWYYVIDVHIKGDIAIVCDFVEGLFFADISDPLNPSYISHKSLYEMSWGIDVEDTLVFVGHYTGGDRMINFSNICNSVEIGKYDTRIWFQQYLSQRIMCT